MVEALTAPAFCIACCRTLAGFVKIPSGFVSKLHLQTDPSLGFHQVSVKTWTWHDRTQWVSTDHSVDPYCYTIDPADTCWTPRYPHIPSGPSQAHRRPEAQPPSGPTAMGLIEFGGPKTSGGAGQDLCEHTSRSRSSHFGKGFAAKRAICCRLRELSTHQRKGCFEFPLQYRKITSRKSRPVNNDLLEKKVLCIP